MHFVTSAGIRIFRARVTGLFWAALAVFCLVFGSGCKKEGQSKDKAAPAGPPATQAVVMPAATQSVTESLSLVGSLTAEEFVEVRAETDGVIAEIPFQEGQEVKQGDLLVRLDDSKLAASVAESEANFKLSETSFKRNESLFKDQLISKQEFEQASATYELNRATLELRKRQLRDTRVVAPFGGTVSGRSVSPGQVISRTTPLTFVVILDPLKVEVNVPERFLSQVKVGQTVELKVATYGDRMFQGEVYFIAPFIDSNTRTAQVKARIQNPQRELKPGMFASLDLVLTVREKAIVIPEVALSQVLPDSRATVYVVDQAQTAQIRTVKLGMRLPGRVEIVEGLKEGENVVVEGVQKIGPGAKIKAAPKESLTPYLKGEQEEKKPEVVP